MSVTIPVHHLQAKNLERADFEIAALETDDDYDAEVPHRHNFYELMLFTAGGGIHEIDFKEYPINALSIHLVSPTQVHKLKSSTAQGHVICFKEEFLSLHPGQSFLTNFPFYNFSFFSPVIEISADVFEEFKMLIAQLEANQQSNSVLRRDFLSAYLKILLLKIKDFFIDNGFSERNAIASTNQKIQEFKKLVDQHYLDHYSVNQYAGLLNISPNYLNALSKKETGSTAIQLVHERILLEAKRLLYSTNLSVKEISHALRFDTDAYFVRFFKKNAGQTPLEYRNNL